MDHIFSENWIYIHYGLILSITCAAMLTVYILSDSTHPPAGLGMYAVYFVVAAISWLIFALQQGIDTTMTIDVSAIAAIIASYILFLAAGQRAGLHRGRVALGLVCLGAGISGFFLDPFHVFIVENIALTIFYIGICILAFLRANQEHNLGDAVVGLAAIIVLGGIAISSYAFAYEYNINEVKFVAFGFRSSGFTLIAMGFLASVLVEYQHHLIQLATGDPLTQLLNRRGLKEALNVSMAAASRGDLSTSAIMVDLDHFKRVNDNFGHDTGDQILLQLSAILTRMARSSDVIARIGGEEFLLVLPDTPLESAQILAERIRAAIDKEALIVDQQRIHITVSLGVACTRGEANLDELSQAADRALYLAKRGGRNRVASVEHKPIHMTADSTKT